MTETYWRERCTAAEAALAKARSAILISNGRRLLLDALGDLRKGEWMDTHQAAEILEVRADHAYVALRSMERVGLVESTPGRRGIGGEPARWRLGYLVQVGAMEVLGPAAEACR